MNYKDDVKYDLKFGDDGFPIIHEKNVLLNLVKIVYIDNNGNISDKPFDLQRCFNFLLFAPDIDYRLVKSFNINMDYSEHNLAMVSIKYYEFVNNISFVGYYEYMKLIGYN
jgi:hypothetical protein